jgi:hypothetical protein
LLILRTEFSEDSEVVIALPMASSFVGDVACAGARDGSLLLNLLRDLRGIVPGEQEIKAANPARRILAPILGRSCDVTTGALEFREPCRIAKASVDDADPLLGEPSFGELASRDAIERLDYVRCGFCLRRTQSDGGCGAAENA